MHATCSSGSADGAVPEGMLPWEHPHRCPGSILTTDCPRHPGDSQHQGGGMTFLHQIHPPKSCAVCMPSLQSVPRLQWEGKFSCSPDSGVNFIPDNGDNSATVHWLFKAQNLVQSCAHLLHLHLILPELRANKQPVHLVKVTMGCECECESNCGVWVCSAGLYFPSTGLKWQQLRY